MTSVTGTEIPVLGTDSAVSLAGFCRWLTGSSMRNSELLRELEGSTGGLKSCSTHSPWVTLRRALDDLNNGTRHTKHGHGCIKTGANGKKDVGVGCSSGGDKGRSKRTGKEWAWKNRGEREQKKPVECKLCRCLAEHSTFSPQLTLPSPRALLTVFCMSLLSFVGVCRNLCVSVPVGHVLSPASPTNLPPASDRGGRSPPSQGGELPAIPKPSRFTLAGKAVKLEHWELGNARCFHLRIVCPKCQKPPLILCMTITFLQTFFLIKMWSL